MFALTQNKFRHGFKPLDRPVVIDFCEVVRTGGYVSFKHHEFSESSMRGCQCGELIADACG